ncbi:hypothetical protein [Glutamicibacter uratoxydans]|uniref:hypothetical protein n=1 Tax=Glutamicibacter uratoxydans TaxID=43667 RepID=UPI003D6EE5B3
MRSEGHAVESICVVLRQQGVRVAARTYRAWKTRLPALRAIEDAKIIDTLRGLNIRDAKGRPRPEILYGRLKMTAWLRRNGFPGNFSRRGGTDNQSPGDRGPGTASGHRSSSKYCFCDGGAGRGAQLHPFTFR